MSLLMEYIFVSMLLYICAAGDAPKFHLDISPEDRLHYFGTEVTEEVPDYEYTVPQPVDRRKRRSTSQTDDNLEYLIDAFGETTHLLLEKNKHLVTPACVVQHMRSNGTSLVYPCAEAEVNCFYTGRTSNHSDSWVSATVCGGFHGMIGMPDKTLRIQPIRDQHKSRVRRESGLTEPHIVYVQKQRTYNDVNDRLAPRSDNTYTRNKRRRRRNDGKKYIETTVVVDPTVLQFHGDETERMVKTVMNVAAERFMDPSLKTPLYMTLNKLVILEEDQAGLRIVEDSSITLDSFCDWQAGWNPVQDSNPEHADYVLLITRLDLEHRGNKANTGLARGGMCGQKTKCSVNEDSGLGTGITIAHETGHVFDLEHRGNKANTGLARGGMCGQKTKCSVNEDSGLGTGITIAHETGHVLGMNHDSAGNGCVDGKNIMSASAAGGPDSWKWSKCSSDSLVKFLQENKCLDDAPPASADRLYAAKVKPGTIYSATQQCKLYRGKDAEVCEGVHANGLDVCGALVCRPKPATGVTGCIIPPTPLMDGTDCGDRKWCIKGSCVDMGPGSPNPVDGNWSEWEPTFSQCSRSCGGGVKFRRRFCNNPEPMYGGRKCPGSDIKAELCNVRECSTSQYHFQAEQCRATNHIVLQGKTYHWVPSSATTGDDSCKTLCQAEGTNFFHKRAISKDGTDCILSESAPYSKCVVGQCKAFGCDGHLGSSHVFDKCGVCNGKGNTCSKKHGTYHGGQAKVFNTFVTIPPASTGITITQKNLYCYLSLDVEGEKLFTENSPKLSGTYNRKGVIIKYQTRPEKIEIVGPITKSIKGLVYRKYGPPYVGVDPDVYYEYHVPTTSQQSGATYLWKTKTGSCSKTCGTGQQVPVITCESSTSGTVADYNCDINQKPAENPQSCNTHACPPRWRSSSWSTCSKSCGGGQKHRTVECVQENNNVETVLNERSCHGQTKPVTTTSCNTEKCPGTWQAGAWSHCSETCGRGLRSRDVKCHSSSSSSNVVDDSICIGADKPATQDYCLIKPCNTDISGSACKDKVSDCFGSYGEAVCTGQYKAWARDNCIKSCGVCVENPSDYDIKCKEGVDNCDQYQTRFCTDTAFEDYDSNCKDEVDNCNQYQTGFCTDTAYKGWAKKNCKKYCNYCDTAPATTQGPQIPDDCEDTDNCEAYGQSVCTEYAAWSSSHCKRFCNLCGQKTNPDCQDAESNCAAYGSTVCTEYEGWAKSHCKHFCGFCGSRRKRDVYDIPPLKKDFIDAPDDTSEENGDVPELIPDIIEEIPHLPEQLFDTLDDIPDEIAPRLKDDIVDGVDDLSALVDISDEIAPRLLDGEVEDIDNLVNDVKSTKDRLNEVISAARELAMADDKSPEKPICNNVLTEPTGQISVIGELVPGVECEQIIALPVDNKVEVTFENLHIDCEQGDELILKDGITNEETIVCDLPVDDMWMSSANIAILKFVAAKEGQGYSATYKSVPRDDYVPACSRIVTSATGEISSSNYPISASMYPDDICDVYIVGTPGKNIQIVFNSFVTSGDVNNCNKNESVVIVDMDGGEEDMFCGELRPFIWESRGSRVRIVYSAGTIFTGKYSVVDI